MDISGFSALTLQYATENLPDRQFLIHCWNNRPTFSYREKEKGSLCSKFRTVDTDVHAYRGIKKKKACLLGCLSFDEVGKSQTNCCLTILRKHDLKKYSYVTCRGEQIPCKFDTYWRQVKSTFSWEADLNTLTACQLKSTFGTKRLMCNMLFVYYFCRPECKV